MTTPSGTISISDVVAEFGTPIPVLSLGNFRTPLQIPYKNRSYSGTYILPLDEGVPTSGTISLGQLRNKTINVLIPFTKDDTSSSNFPAYTYPRVLDYYNSSGSAVGWKSKPPLSSSDPRKILVFVGSSVGATLYAAGFPNSVISLSVLIGRYGIVGGKGGDGGSVDGNYGWYGQGYLPPGPTQQGEPGSPAIIVDRNTKITILPNGYLVAGGGGGGAGGRSLCDPDHNPGDPACSGGGGGGGCGLPGGLGGIYAISGHYTYEATNGTSGTLLIGGEGGRGASSWQGLSPRNCAEGGGGGGGAGLIPGQGGYGGAQLPSTYPACYAGDNGSPGTLTKGGDGGDAKGCQYSGWTWIQGGLGGLTGNSVLKHPSSTVTIDNISGTVYGTVGSYISVPPYP